MRRTRKEMEVREFRRTRQRTRSFSTRDVPNAVHSRSKFNASPQKPPLHSGEE